MLPSCFITGTDTDVGKTVVTAMILKGWSKKGLSCAGIKPVASGFELIDGELRNSDIDSIKAASSYELPQTLINQYSFEPAIAPHIAATEDGVNISEELIHERFKDSKSRVDRIVVEGAGGWRVPLSMPIVGDETGLDGEKSMEKTGLGKANVDKKDLVGKDVSIATLAKALNLPVILVVGMKLGCINHALLSAEAIIGDGLPFLGWIANNPSPTFDRKTENLETLKALMPGPFLFEVPYLCPNS